MKPRVAAACRIASSLIAILFGAQLIMSWWPPPPEIPILESAIFAPHLVAAWLPLIACGVLALLRPWNILVPMWLYLAGMIFYSMLPDFFVSGSLPRLLEPVLPSLYALGFVLAILATVIGATSRSSPFPPGNRVATGTAALSFSVALVFLWDAARAEYWDYAARGAVYSIAPAVAAIAALRGRRNYLVPAFAVSAGGAAEGFFTVLLVLQSGISFDRPGQLSDFPNMEGPAYERLPDAFAFLAALLGIVLSVFFARSPRPNHAAPAVLP